jgi:hypothetical protein
MNRWWQSLYLASIAIAILLSSWESIFFDCQLNSWIFAFWSLNSCLQVGNLELISFGSWIALWFTSLECIVVLFQKGESHTIAQILLFLLPTSLATIYSLQSLLVASLIFLHFYVFINLICFIPLYTFLVDLLKHPFLKLMAIF